MGLVTKITDQKDAFEETMSFVKELISGKSMAQINGIVGTVNRASHGEADPSKGCFEAALAEAMK